jgi:hypothetical protein
MLKKFKFSISGFEQFDSGIVDSFLHILRAWSQSFLVYSLKNLKS